jgi:hypothetical protein
VSATFLIRAETVDRRITDLQMEHERWQSESQIVDVCYGLEELSFDYLDLYGTICRLDHHWHMEVLTHPECFKQSMSDRLHHLFEHWATAARRLLDVFAGFQQEYQQRGFDTDATDRLAAAYRECDASLNPSDVEITELANLAIEQHRAGLTEDFECFSDSK